MTLVPKTGAPRAGRTDELSGTHNQLDRHLYTLDLQSLHLFFSLKGPLM